MDMAARRVIHNTLTNSDQRKDVFLFEDTHHHRTSSARRLRRAFFLRANPPTADRLDMIGCIGGTFPVRRSAGRKRVAPRVGFEPTTSRLTVGCSTTELPRNRFRSGRPAL